MPEIVRTVRRMNIAFIGLGEAAAALITGWGPVRAGQIVAYDIKLDAPEAAAENPRPGFVARNSVL